MHVNLSREDLISLIKGSSPHYDLFDHPIIKNCGSYDGNAWRWDYSFGNDLTEKELWNLYVLCRDSWINSGRSSSKPQTSLFKTVISAFETNNKIKGWTFPDGTYIPNVFPKVKTTKEFIDESISKLPKAPGVLTAVLPICDKQLFSGDEYRGVKLEFDERLPFDRKYLFYK